MTAPLLTMGATSGIGALAVEEAVGRGLPVHALARSVDSLEKSDLIAPFAGDARSAEDVSAALAGTRAVIYALGIKERLAMLWEPATRLFRTLGSGCGRWRRPDDP